MIGISFGEVVVIGIVACLFIKPSEMQEMMAKFFKFRSQFQDSIDKIKQDIAISDYTSSLNQMYQDIIQEPKASEEKIESINAYGEDFIAHDIPNEEANLLENNINHDRENYDLFFDHMPKVIKQSKSMLTESELTYLKLKMKLNN